jgi:hypothetical protein
MAGRREVAKDFGAKFWDVLGTGTGELLILKQVLAAPCWLLRGSKRGQCDQLAVEICR